ncbi:hypothetical protein ALC62_10517 [Cyphomyrmex costatus]|uniref:Uncharacterized protein n=1 Tax=Cyphomyrmex costatus TaxID=456900 RepID=A0A195CCV4_9HYME|nr:hypothetical protein ALC62_10517 [Cyphomyrmex costatus]
MPPFFRAVIKLDKPFSCFQVTKTSSRKSNAKLSLTRCSLIKTESTVGGTEPFEIHNAVILASLILSLELNKIKYSIASTFYLFKISHRVHVLWLFKNTCTSFNWLVSILSDGTTRN